MKLANKIILFPVVIIVTIFTLGIFALEAQIAHTLDKHLTDELTSLSTISLSSAKLITPTEQQKYTEQLNFLAQQIAQASHASVYYYSLSGERLAGSDNILSDKLLRLKNNKDDNPVANYQLRYLNLPETGQTWALLSQQDNQLGLISQVALPQNYYKGTLLGMRWGISIIGVIILFAIVIFASIAIKLIDYVIQRERGKIEEKVSAKTKEITLIQAMVTMVNSANSVKSAGIMLTTILPRLLPGYSGAIYLSKVPEKKLNLLNYWGDETFRHIQAYLRSDHDEIRYELEFPSCFQLSDEFKERSVQVNLKNKKGHFGVAFFFNPKGKLTIKARETIEQLSKHMSDALANVLLTEQLRSQATKDPLTNLYNRRFMQEFLAKVVHRAERHHGCVAVLMIDLDHFKSFNDKFGHEAGDLILANVAQELMINIRLEDIACRYGGEEFCIICPDTQLVDAYHLAEKLRIKISKLSLTYQNQQLDNITMSVGIAIYPNHAPSCQVLILKADQALYQAKAQGRNRSVVIANDISENTASL